MTRYDIRKKLAANRKMPTAHDFLISSETSALIRQLRVREEICKTDCGGIQVRKRLIAIYPIDLDALATPERFFGMLMRDMEVFHGVVEARSKEALFHWCHTSLHVTVFGSMSDLRRAVDNFGSNAGRTKTAIHASYEEDAQQNVVALHFEWFTRPCDNNSDVFPLYQKIYPFS